MNRIREFLPDASDTLAVIGVVLIGAGVWLISPAAALIVVGALLIAAALRIG